MRECKKLIQRCKCEYFLMHNFAMASTSNNTVASCTIFLREDTHVRFPYASICTSPTRVEIKLGTVSNYVTFIPSSPSSPTEVYVPRLPSGERRPNVIPPNEFPKDVSTSRTSVFEKLAF